MTVSAPSSAVVSAPDIGWSDPVSRARADLARPDVSREQLLRALAEILEVAEQALHCPVTDLWTRAEWTRQATRAVATSRSAIVFLDLDGFKAINDTHGHEAGDAILRAVGARLGTWCRDADGIPARLGGDEFVLLVPAGCWLHTERTVLRDELTVPVEYGTHTLQFGASIGTAIIALGHEETAAQRLSAALHQADMAMYQDKAARRGGQTLDRRGRPVTALTGPAR